MKIAAYSEKGSNKTECQDKILIGDTILSEGYYQTERLHFPLVVAVADGVGGNAAGEVAAFMAVNGIRCWNRFPFLDEEYIRRELCEVNAEIVQTGKEDESCTDMACTLTGFYLEYDSAVMFHAGNTRAGLYTGYLEWMTEDHTVAAEADDADEVVEDNMITAGMGNGDCDFLEDRLVVKKQNVYFSNNNIVLLTSDGIHDHVEDIVLEELLTESLSGADWEKGFCEKVTALARECGSEDDISIVLIHARKDVVGEEEKVDG